MKKIIIYADGACKGNPGGVTGYGAHIVKADTDIKSKQILGKWVVTDKGYQPKAIAKTNDITLFGIDKIVDLYGYTLSNTNNQAELDAVIKALELLENDVIKDYFGEYDKILLILDSQYVLGTIDKVLNNDPRYNDMANQPHLQILKKLMIKIGLDKFETLKVNGHSGHIGNDRADLLANMGVVRALRKLDNQKVITSNGNDYWKLDFTKNDLIDSKLVFGYTNNSKKDNTYYMLNYSDEEDLGKRDKDVVYDILKLNEPLKELDMIMNLLSEITDTTIKPFVVKLNEFYNKQIMKNIELYGTDYLVEDTTVIARIKTVDNVIIANEVYPPSLSYLALEISALLENKLNDFLNGNPNGIAVDITDRLYDGKGLKKEFKNDKFTIKVKTDVYTFTLVPGLDILHRNNLKRIEKDNPKVYLIYEVLDYMVRYYTITTTDKGSILRSNYYVNLMPIPSKKLKKK